MGPKDPLARGGPDSTDDGAGDGLIGLSVEDLGGDGPGVDGTGGATEKEADEDTTELEAGTGAMLSHLRTPR